MFTRRRDGFTLIELLVVIAIILVLAAILFPIFAAAQRAAVRSTCSSHIRQIGLAIQQYCGDNNGKTPPGCQASPGVMVSYSFPAPPHWMVRVRPYLKSPRMIICPAVTPSMLAATDNLFYRPNPVPLYGQTTYGLNWRFTNGGALCPPPNQQGTRMYNGITQTLEAPPMPSRTVLLIETQNYLKWAGDAADKPWGTATIQVGGNIMPFGDYGNFWFWAIRWHDYPAIPFGHTGGCNVALADGHVKFVKAPKPPFPIASSNTEKDGAIYKAGLNWWVPLP
jgi:prepilin-type N-terminal cleavage/methylation domain-containing protein/prepilin-type processing-associated H-X9-DG protein